MQSRKFINNACVFINVKSYNNEKKKFKIYLTTSTYIVTSRQFLFLLFKREREREREISSQYIYLIRRQKPPYQNLFLFFFYFYCGGNKRNVGVWWKKTKAYLLKNMVEIRIENNEEMNNSIMESYVKRWSKLKQAATVCYLTS